jgi:hypothetical protein
LEIIDYELTKAGTFVSVDFIRTSIRGFVLMLLMPEMEDCTYFSVFEQIINLFKTCNDKLRDSKDD